MRLGVVRVTSVPDLSVERTEPVWETLDFRIQPFPQLADCCHSKHFLVGGFEQAASAPLTLSVASLRSGGRI